MNSSHLSDRLQAVADFVPKNSIVADIGSDHAYLPIYLAETNVISSGIAGEVAQGPLNNAIHEITKANLLDIITPRLANGLAAIEPTDHVDTITIAGMGGTLISQILTEGQNVLKNQPLLILQPNIGEDIVREWLMNNHYKIIEEAILAEGGHTYEIIVAKAVVSVVHYTSKQLRFGPKLMQVQNDAFLNKWRHELATNQQVLRDLEQAVHVPKEKVEKIKNKVTMISEVLNNEG